MLWSGYVIVADSDIEFNSTSNKINIFKITSFDEKLLHFKNGYTFFSGHTVYIEFLNTVEQITTQMYFTSIKHLIRKHHFN